MLCALVLNWNYISPICDGIGIVILSTSINILNLRVVRGGTNFD